jgi:hypothetical protein
MDGSKSRLASPSLLFGRRNILSSREVARETPKVISVVIKQPQGNRIWLFSFNTLSKKHISLSITGKPEIPRLKKQSIKIPTHYIKNFMCVELANNHRPNR